MNDFSIFKDGWDYQETICGWGSTLSNTKNVLHGLSVIINEFDIIKINDAGCGDLWWIQHFVNQHPTIDYKGYDLYDRPSWKELNIPCEKLDISAKPMRPSDLIICRDVFIHWPNHYILKALDLFRQTGKLLYSTTYTGEHYEFENTYRITDFSMKHSKLSLCSPPFNLGTPIYITTENYRTKCCQKIICLWRL